jgi:hypothetical protein
MPRTVSEFYTVSGPVKFPRRRRYHGKKGKEYISTTATTPCMSLTNTSLKNDLNPVFSRYQRTQKDRRTWAQFRTDWILLTEFVHLDGNLYEGRTLQPSGCDGAGKIGRAGGEMRYAKESFHCVLWCIGNIFAWQYFSHLSNIADGKLVSH